MGAWCRVSGLNFWASGLGFRGQRHLWPRWGRIHGSRFGINQGLSTAEDSKVGRAAGFRSPKPSSIPNPHTMILNQFHPNPVPQSHTPKAERSPLDQLDSQARNGVHALEGSGCMMEGVGVGFGAPGVGCRVLGFGFRGQESGSRTHLTVGLGFRVSGFRFRLSAFGFQVSGFWLRVEDLLEGRAVRRGFVPALSDQRLHLLRANMAHVRQPRLDFGIGRQVKVLQAM